MFKRGDVSRRSVESVPLRLSVLIAALLTVSSAHAGGAPPYSIVDLGTLGGTNSNGNGINSIGQVVGSSTLSGDQYTHGFLYSNGAMKDIGTLGGNKSDAT